MKKTIRLTEADLTRIVRRVIKEQTAATANNLSVNPASLLDNTSREFNQKIGVQSLPNCFKYSTETQKTGIFNGEIDKLVDLLDFPMGNDNVQAATQWAQGNGFPGMFGGQGNWGDLNLRVTNNNGLWYPAVEELRVKYNSDESLETLGGISKKKELAKFRDSLLQAYQYWINCINKK